MATCPDCGAEFTPKLPQRVYCYNPKCKATRIERNNRAKMERVKKLKEEGKWQEHLRQVAGVGKGTLRFGVKSPVTIKERKCLKCDKMFDVPATSDDHICGDCHIENDELLAEYNEEALGLTPIPPTSTVREYEG